MADRYARYQRLKFDRPSDGVLRVTMSNPGRLNAADATMHRELAEIWRDVDADPDVRCVVLTGEGTAFSAGGDFEMIQQIVSSGPGPAIGRGRWRTCWTARTCPSCIAAPSAARSGAG